MSYEDWDLYILLFVLIGIVEFMITFIEKLIFEEKELMSHEYDVFSWYCLTFIRAAMFVYFTFALRDELL